MRIFKTKLFARFARKERISDKKLCDEVERIESGLVDADLGFDVYKQRIARSGEGRSGGYRVIILLQVAKRAFFVHGIVKSRTADIEPSDIPRFRDMAEKLFEYDNDELEYALEKGEMVEIVCDDNENIQN